METIFDWLSVLIFSGLAVLYLQRSAAEEPQDKVWQYLPPAIGCAAANYVGNHISVLPAVGLLVATMAYIYYVLRPKFSR